MKTFIKIYILISIAIFIFSIYEVSISYGGLIHKTKARYYTMEQLSNPEKTEVEQFKENLKKILNKNIVYSCIYGCYAVLSIVFGYIVLSKTKKE
ncbi:hypothetical protein [Dysgonomonas sp.]|jgi:hypothetical protein|nr:hypothetical protein [Prevotella sp.]